MPLVMLLIFIAVPLLELALLIWIGKSIGLMLTIGLVVTTAVIGTTVLQYQGFAVLARAQQAMMRGQMPVEPVLDGMALLLAGAFLITPGLITDTFGFLLLVPHVRRLFAKFMLARVLKWGRIEVRTYDGRPGETPRSGQPGRDQKTGDGPVIEGEFERLDEKTVPPGRRGADKDKRS
ncbi:MAG: FxsA family protein [Hyphomicrobiaceae bacterium]|nr:FxsA family protein [Hyphomicrobiaceae bacterium]